MKIEIIKAHKLLVVGQVLEIDRGYSLDLIEKGIAKSLEIKEEVQEGEVKNDLTIELQEVICEGRSLISDLKAIIDSFTPITGSIESTDEVNQVEEKEIILDFPKVPEVVEPTLKKIK